VLGNLKNMPQHRNGGKEQAAVRDGEAVKTGRRNENRRCSEAGRESVCLE